MSGFFSKMFGNKLWKTVYYKLPATQKENIRKTVDAADRVFDQEHARETGVPLSPEPQHPTMPQAEVNKAFREKEKRIHPRAHGKL